MKTIRPLSIFALIMFVLFAACEEDTFIETIGICPLVIATNPDNNDTNVPLSQVITVTFNEEMNPATITETSFTIESGAAISGTVTYSGLTATFTPSAPLQVGTTHTGRIKTTVKDLNGNALQQEYVWVFSTGATVSPMVISTSPEDDETDVVLNKIIIATFSQPMDALSINETSFILMDGSTAITGVITYNDVTATFTPTVNLEANTLYTVTITTDATNDTAIPLENDYVWSFTTGNLISPMVMSTDPEDDDIDIALDKTITAIFSQPMDVNSIDETTFTLQEGTNFVTGTISYNALTASFVPSDDLLPGTLYKATITTGATNAAGIPLANVYEWEFTTIETPFNPTIDLGSVERFGIISGVAVSNNAGPSEIHDLDIGIYPGARSSITGFFDVDGGPGLIFNGDFYAANDADPVPAMLLQAKDDLTVAYLAAEGATSPAPTTVAGDLGGQTLPPGIYKSNSTLMIQNGNLTLDGQGDPNAEWIFQIASDFTTVGGSPYPSPAGGNVILIGGAQAKNIIWQVGSSAVIGDYTSFKGNVLALTSVTMNAYSQAEGRMLCSNGAVTLTSTNFIYRP
ncbi:Ig-like domain-containing protein [Confluentibacter citreus]|uniref:Ig-like domain-containing protein n=1 Tax=Confluentibacter citreus TaxID=2007307 RepID=UPI000C28A9E5|nr:ice-binding family protein [Confluentibacter citreus]